MQIFTIGFTQKSAETFFGLIRSKKIDLLVDIRLYNNTQLAGFSKARDLRYFLRELCSCDYIHTPQFAPDEALFRNYKNGEIDWDGYVSRYNRLLDERNPLAFFETHRERRMCLLCTEPTAEHCHRRLLAERVAREYDGVEVREV